MKSSVYVSSDVLRDVLRHASAEELFALTKVLDDDATEPLPIDTVQQEVCRVGGHSVFNALRGEGVAYSELLYDAAEKLGVDKPKSRIENVYKDLSIWELDSRTNRAAAGVPDSVRFELVMEFVDGIERQILSRVMFLAYEKATPEQRAEVDALLSALTQTDEARGLTGMSTGAALLVVGNLGGFATFTFMSTVLSALSLGSLGFGAYTFASSLLSLALGPLGWLTLLGYGAHKMGSPNEAKAARLAANCAFIHQRFKDERRRAKV